MKVRIHNRIGKYDSLWVCMFAFLSLVCASALYISCFFTLRLQLTCSLPDVYILNLSANDQFFARQLFTPLIHLSGGVLHTEWSDGPHDLTSPGQNILTRKVYWIDENAAALAGYSVITDFRRNFLLSCFAIPSAVLYVCAFFGVRRRVEIFSDESASSATDGYIFVDADRCNRLFCIVYSPLIFLAGGSLLSLPISEDCQVLRKGHRKLYLYKFLGCADRARDILLYPANGDDT